MGCLSEESIEKLGAFDDSVQRLKQGSEAAKRVMGTVLLPQLQTLADENHTSRRFHLRLSGGRRRF